MLLRIFATTGVRLIALNKEFFSQQEEIKRGKTVTLTPKEKAAQFAQDLFGSALEGFVLEKNGKTIHNSFQRVNKSPEISQKPAVGSARNHLSSVGTSSLNQKKPDFGQHLPVKKTFSLRKTQAQD